MNSKTYIKWSISLLSFLPLTLFAQITPVKAVEHIATFRLIELPYPANALSPIISKQTIELHHGKHLQSYVNQTNKLRQGTKWAGASLETIVKESDGALFNNAGQLLNHNLYFTQFAPKPIEKAPKGRLKKLLEDKWGSFEDFQKRFEESGVSLFGSGWVWLSIDNNGECQISLYSGGDNPITKGWTPLLGIDLWEHAYYLDYQNRRADHLKAVWQIIDWSIVSSRLPK